MSSANSGVLPNAVSATRTSGPSSGASLPMTSTTGAAVRTGTSSASLPPSSSGPHSSQPISVSGGGGLAPTSAASFNGVDFGSFSRQASLEADDGRIVHEDVVVAPADDVDSDVRGYFADETNVVSGVDFASANTSMSLPGGYHESGVGKVVFADEHEPKWFIAVVFFLIGCGPFSCINTMWSQTAIFRSCLPEGNGIASLIGSAYNAANVLPIVYMFLLLRYRLSDKWVMIVGTVFGVVVSVALALFWQVTEPIASTPTSIVVVGMAFAAGVVGTLLGIVVFSYAAEFSPVATTWLSTGMGVNGTLITGLGVLQKLLSHKNGLPLFSPNVAFAICAVQMGLALAAMILVEWRRWLRARAPLGDYQPLVDNDGDDDGLINAESHDADVKLTRSRELVDSADALPARAAPAPPHAAGAHEKESKAQFWAVLWAATYPIVTQFFKSVMVYFISPGLLPFLSGADTLVNVLFFTASFANLIGRLGTARFHFKQLWIVNVFCLACLLYELAVAAWPTIVGKNEVFPLPSWVLVPVTGVSALANGYVSTEVFFAGDRRVRELLGSDQHIKRVRRWVSVSNQIGGLVGAYLCVAVVHAGLLGPFRRDPIGTDPQLLSLCFYQATTP